MSGRMTELEAAVEALAPEELRVFDAWYDAFLARVWEERVAADDAAGHLDGLRRTARGEHARGETTPL